MLVAPDHVLSAATAVAQDLSAPAAVAQEHDQDEAQEDVEFVELPPKQAQKARYPVGCSVLFFASVKETANATANAIANATSCQMGVVTAVGIDVDSSTRANCYRVLTGRQERYLKEDDLQFAPQTPVWLTLANTVPATQVPGIVLASDHAFDTRDGSLVRRYTVQGKHDSAQSPICYADISPNMLRFRQPETTVKEAPAPTPSQASTDASQPPPPPVTTLVIPSSSNSSTTALSYEALSETSDHQLVSLASSVKTEPSLATATETMLDTPVAMPPIKTETTTNEASTTILRRPKEYASSPLAAVNLQPNPFQYIEITDGHCIPRALQQLKSVAVRGGGDALKSHGCLSFHLQGYCPYGTTCRWAGTHRDLTNDQARAWEASLRPVMGPLGPILAQDPHTSPLKGPTESQLALYRAHGNGVAHNTQPNPFSSIDVGRHDHSLGMARSRILLDLQHRGQPIPLVFHQFCWNYHLCRTCRLGMSCPRVASHQDLTPHEAREVEHALGMVITPAGPIFAKLHHTTTVVSGGSPPSSRGQTNHHPNPFRRIVVGPGHSKNAILNFLKHNSIPSYRVLANVCLGYHLMGYCAFGHQCVGALYHTTLPAPRARHLEDSLGPLIDAHGILRDVPTWAPPLGHLTKTECLEATGKVSVENIASPDPVNNSKGHPMGIKKRPSMDEDEGLADITWKRTRRGKDWKDAGRASVPITSVKVESGVRSVSIPFDLSIAACSFGK